VLRVVPESALPDWYTAQIKFLAQDHLRISWIGLYLATREEVHALDPREISTWLHAPTSRLSGFCFNQSAMDPTTAPDGVNLMVAGGIIPGSKARDLGYVQRMFELFEADLKTMYPGLKDAYWRRRHLVHDPSFGVIQKPALVGKFRPHWRAPNVEGLGAVLRLGDVPESRDRRRSRRACRAHRGRGLPRAAPGRRLRLALLMGRLDGRVAVVTGAASGIGYAIAGRLASELLARRF
jgi:hypothetical protein